jgi:hypothetical protein
MLLIKKMMLLAGRHIYGKSHVDLIVETFLDLPVILRISYVVIFVEISRPGNTTKDP